ncbi:TetR/AcrR family transcriptional regulator [Rufibacter roseus]|uniref:TetR/AcrR family transcriptional regulator n=1 Tax=Rufibacter roseus TaxID=1567108 RepID=A0ABW2DT65_9BACT|nr:TetR/AcrR family transcriptional regulator [Rufibacter roseus]
MNKRVLKRETSAQNILESAMELFAQQGFDRTSIRQIAQSAGISLGLLYNYYSSKEELLKAGLLKGRQSVLESYQKPEELSAYQFLDHHVRTTFKVLEENRNFWKLYYSLRLQSDVVKALEKELEAENQKRLNLLTQHLAAAGSTSPTAEARLMVATLDGMAHHYLMHPDYPLQDVLIRYLLQLKNHLKSD